ncbi:MAG TPA: helix-turn-helix transcriptional regulator [Actinospica sp.]|nr:helix-turn-helix transcriptional regulator [Actinospica sp.]
MEIKRAGRPPGSRTAEEEQAAKAKLEAHIRAHRLAEIRREQHLTQVEVAEAMGTVQHNLCRIERGEPGSAEIDVIRRYVEALGGHLRIIADFGDRQFDAA